MPNGVDKNLVRLSIACAQFRATHGTWPSEARVAPIVMWSFGQLFDLDNFEQLCKRLRLRTTTNALLAVGTTKAHHVYSGAEGADWQRVDEARAWLGVRIRDELRHIDD